jgi:hypothetical protein
MWLISFCPVPLTLMLRLQTLVLVEILPSIIPNLVKSVALLSNCGILLVLAKTKAVVDIFVLYSSLLLLSVLLASL